MYCNVSVILGSVVSGRRGEALSAALFRGRGGQGRHRRGLGPTGWKQSSGGVAREHLPVQNKM